MPESQPTLPVTFHTSVWKSLMLLSGSIAFVAVCIGIYPENPYEGSPDGGRDRWLLILAPGDRAIFVY